MTTLNPYPSMRHTTPLPLENKHAHKPLSASAPAFHPSSGRDRVNNSYRCVNKNNNNNNNNIPSPRDLLQRSGLHVQRIQLPSYFADNGYSQISSLSATAAIFSLSKKRIVLAPDQPLSTLRNAAAPSTRARGGRSGDSRCQKRCRLCPHI